MSQVFGFVAPLARGQGRVKEAADARVEDQKLSHQRLANEKVEPGSLGSNAGRQGIDESEQGFGLLKCGHPKRKDFNNG